MSPHHHIKSSYHHRITISSYHYHIIGSCGDEGGRSLPIDSFDFQTSSHPVLSCKVTNIKMVLIMVTISSHYKDANFRPVLCCSFSNGFSIIMITAIMIHDHAMMSSQLQTSSLPFPMVLIPKGYEACKMLTMMIMIMP